MKSLGFLKKIAEEQLPLLLLLLLIAFFSIFSPIFFSFQNLFNVIFQITINGIMAIGITFVMIGGGFDLSIGYTMALSAILAVNLQSHFNVFFSCLIAIIAGIFIGFINGIFVTKLKINPFIATLGMFITLNGLILWYTGGYHNFPKYFSFKYISYGKLFYIPFPIWIFILFIIIAYIILAKTKLGKRIYAIGGSEDICRIFGLNVDRIKIFTYMISGFTAAISGLIIASWSNVSTPEFGKNTMFIVIGAVVLGGVSLEGGVGGIFNAIVGILIFGIIQNGLGFLNLVAYYQYIIWGSLLLIVVIADRYRAIRRRRMQM